MSCNLRILGSVLFTATILLAQFGSGIQGTILDSSGAVLPGAHVVVTNLGTGITRETVASEAGIYRVPSLNPGAYKVAVDKNGFNSALQSSVEIGSDEIRRVDFTLQVGGSSEKITVSAEPTLLETEQGRISGKLNEKQLRDLPAPGRNVFNLLSLQPGVTGRSFGNDMYAGEPAPGVRSSGQRSESNYYTVDDTSINSVSRGGTINMTPNLDSVAEVRVISHNYSADEGRNSGAHIQVVSKSGTNQFHGTLSEAFQNNTLSLRTIFDSNVPAFRQNQFGGTLGGPIIRNRTFFFTSYEGFRKSGARAATATVETPQFRDWVTVNRPNSIAAKMLSSFRPVGYPTFNIRDLGSPRPGVNVWSTVPDGIPDIGTVQYVPVSAHNGDQFNIRVDHELRPGKDRLYGNWYRTQLFDSTTGVRPEFNRPQTDTSNFGNLNYTHMFSPNMLNELRAGVIRLTGIPSTLQHPEVPEINITGESGYQSVNLFPGGWFQTNFNVKDTLSLIRGTHTFKLGGELRRMRNNLRNTRSYIPVYTFNSILDFADDEAFQMSRTVDPRNGEPSITDCAIRVWEGAAFLQDDWKFRRNITINLGLRYEYYGPITDAGGKLRTFLFGSGSRYQERFANGKVDVVSEMWSANKLNLGPRFGFAWDIGGKGTTAIRGGYGVSFDRLATVVPGSYRDNPPLRAVATLGSTLGTTFTYTLGDPNKQYFGYPVDPGLRLGLDEHNGIKGARVNVVGVDPSFRNPYSHDWFVGIQRALPSQIVIEASYFGSAGHHLVNVVNPNRFTGDLLDGRLDGLNKSFLTVSMSQSTSNSIFHGGTVSMTKRYSKGYSLEAAFTYGKVITDAETAQGLTNYSDAYNRNLDRSLASFDVPKRLSLVGTWDLPFLRRCSTIACKVLGAWQLSGFAVLEKGTPISVVTSAAYPRGDFNADGTNFDRPNAPSDSILRKGYTKDQFLNGIFNVADFPLPAPGQYGNLGRNTFRGPGFARTDLSIGKTFAVTERVSSVLRLEAYNALNRVNLNAPSTDLTSNNFGKVTSASTPRTLQASLQVRF